MSYDATMGIDLFLYFATINETLTKTTNLVHSHKNALAAKN